MATASTTNRSHGAARDGVLVLSAWAYLIGMSVHATDHLYRGITGDDRTASWPGTLQVALSVVAVALPVTTLLFIRTGHRWAPLVGAIVGFGSAVVFFSLHVLPSWSAITDSFIGAGAGAQVTEYSWITAGIGIGGSNLLGLAGALALRRGTVLGARRPERAL